MSTNYQGRVSGKVLQDGVGTLLSRRGTCQGRFETHAEETKSFLADNDRREKMERRNVTGVSADMKILALSKSSHTHLPGDIGDRYGQRQEGC